MFTSQRLIAPRAFDSLNRPHISREAGRAHMRASAYANGAAMSARHARTVFVIDGRFDRGAIMRAALACAHFRRRATGDAWASCLADALRGVWTVARAQRGTVRPATKH